LIIGFFAKKKSEDAVMSIITRFREENLSAPKFSGKHFIFLQSDNGEFSSSQVRAYSWRSGIFQRFSSPHHSLMNGPVERAIKKVKTIGKCMLEERHMPQIFWEDAAKMAIYVLNRTPNRYEGRWQREAMHLMFGISTDYSRFRVPFSKAYVMKRPAEIRKDWKKKGYKGILVGISDVDYTVWVPELGAEIQSTNVIIDESAQGELETGEIYPEITEKDREKLVERTYTVEDFEYLRGTEHIDNEDGLSYKVLDIRRHRGRNGSSIVVDRKCSSGGAVDTIYALDAAALTDASSAVGHKAAGGQSAAVSSVPERRASGVKQSEVGELSRDSLLARASETGDSRLVHELLAAGVKPNTTAVSGTGREPGKVLVDKAPGGAKRALGGVEDFRRKSSRLGNIKSINYHLTQYTLVESYQADGEIRSYFIPKTYAQAIACEDSAHWIRAMEEELAGLEDAGCFEIEILPEGANAIPAKWIFTVKTDSLGRLVRFKARLVAGGHRQVEGIDFVETFSPTVSWDSVRLFLALTVSHNLVPLQLDVDMAYLYGDIEPDVTIFMRAPDGIKLPGGSVYRLKKSLYGLKQAGRIWNKLIDDKLRGIGFIPLDSDSCVYIRRRDDEVALLLLYVDDIICSASNREILIEVVDYLRASFKLKLMGVPTNVDLPIPSQLLGLELIWGENFSSVQINSGKLVRELLRDQYKDEGTRPNKVPVDPTFKFSKNDVLIDNGNLSNQDKAMQKSYRSIVGVVIFLVTTCRVDIAFAATQLARYMSKPGYRHYRAANYLLSYLSGTVDLGIAFYSTGNRRIYAYADSDFGSDESRKACAGYVFILANGPIKWKCAFSQEIPLSTCEAEVRAVSAMLEPVKHCIWIDRVLNSLGLGEEYTSGSVQISSSIDSSVISPMTVYEDNQAAIAWTSNPIMSKKMKHVERNLFWVREEIMKKTFSLVWIETSNQIADLFTKALAAVVYWRFVDMLTVSANKFRETNGGV